MTLNELMTVLFYTGLAVQTVLMVMGAGAIIRWTYRKIRAWVVEAAHDAVAIHDADDHAHRVPGAVIGGGITKRVDSLEYKLDMFIKGLQDQRAAEYYGPMSARKRHNAERTGKS